MFIFTNENGTQVLQSGADLMQAASNVPCGTRVFVMHNEAGELVSAGRSAAEMARSEPIFKAMRNGAPLAKSATMDADDAKIQANESSHNQKQVKKTDVQKLVVLKAKKKAAAVADEDHQDDETEASEASEEMAKAFSGTRLGLLGIIAELQALKDQTATA